LNLQYQSDAAAWLERQGMSTKGGTFEPVNVPR